MTDNDARRDLTHELVLPTLLFAVLGAMTWAIRGCSGFGGTSGCIFAGVMWGAAWWFIARDPGAEQSRRYASGWIILALTVGEVEHLLTLPDFGSSFSRIPTCVM